MIFINFPQNLKEIRRSKGFSQEDLANLTQLNINTYRHYEHGIYEPNLTTLEKIKVALGCSYDDLLK